jgi:hypothetical protein
MTLNHDEAHLDADDALLTALSYGHDPDPDDTVAALMAVWHEEISSPLPPPSPELQAAVRPRRARRRWFARPLTIAVGTGVLAFGGATAFAATAQPDSPLWPITKVVYPAKAESRTADAAATRLLDRAATAIDTHRYPDALDALAAAEQQINLVTDDDARSTLEDRWVDLRARLLAATADRPGVTPTPTVAASAAVTPLPTPTGTHATPSQGGLLPLPPLSSILPSLPLLGG